MRTTLFVDNLPSQLTEVEFEQFVGECHPLRVLVATHRSGRCLGFGFLMFESRQDADRACRQLNGKLLKGSPVRVSDRITPDYQLDVQTDVA